MTEKAGLEMKKEGKEKPEKKRPVGATLFKFASAVEAATRIRGAAKYVECEPTSRTHALVRTHIPHIQHRETYVFLFIYFFPVAAQ